jgi:carboxymethylenebutenolidase
MSQTVEFPSNGDTASGYLAVPTSGTGPGLLVIQEWWGLVPQIKRTCDRLANEGFVALAPDLYRGECAEHTEMDKANELMQSLPPDRAARDMNAAIDYLLGHQAVRGDAVGVIGFCMGGMLTLLIAALSGDKVRAATPFYGAPLDDMAPDWSGLTAHVQGHFAEKDDFFPPEKIKALETQLTGMGKDVEFTVYPGTGHAFGNEENALGTYDKEATERSWTSAVEFLRRHLA